jgi:hypothetical protein
LAFRVSDLARDGRAPRADLQHGDQLFARLLSFRVGVSVGDAGFGFLSDTFGRAGFAPANFKLMCPGGAPPHGEPSAVQQACAAASATGIRQAVMAMSVFLLWAAVHYFLAARTLRADLLKQRVALPTH